MADRKHRLDDKLLKQAFLELAQEEVQAQKNSLAADPALSLQAEESYQNHAPHVRWLIRHNTRKKKQTNPIRWLSVAAALLIMLWGGWQLTQLPAQDVVTPLGPDQTGSPSSQGESSPPAWTTTPLITAAPPTISPTPTPTPTVTPSPTPLVFAWSGNYFPANAEHLFEAAELSTGEDYHLAVLTSPTGHQLRYIEFKERAIPHTSNEAAASYIQLKPGIIAFVTADATGTTLTWDEDIQTLQVHTTQGREAAIALALAIEKIK
ncbi:MAG: hypothetical protein GXZ04_07785 [Clostridiales bacterium]|nr:hypothetical protein [Clostridiales bacterium]